MNNDYIKIFNWGLFSYLEGKGHLDCPFGINDIFNYRAWMDGYHHGEDEDSYDEEDYIR